MNIDEPNAAKRLNTIREAAHLLNLSADTVRRMIAKGELPAVRLRRTVRVDPRDLERLIQNNRETLR